MVLLASEKSRPGGRSRRRLMACGVGFVVLLVVLVGGFFLESDPTPPGQRAGERACADALKALGESQPDYDQAIRAAKAEAATAKGLSPKAWSDLPDLVTGLDDAHALVKPAYRTVATSSGFTVEATGAVNAPADVARLNAAEAALRGRCLHAG